MITNLVSRRSESPVAPATGSGRVIPARVRPQTSQTYYHRNQQYSIVGLTNAAGTLVERYTYSAYGTLGIYAANGTVRTSSTYANRYTYTGREWDAELRLYHFRARWYDPATGGFVARDPLGHVDGMSLYRGYFAVRLLDADGRSALGTPVAKYEDNTETTKDPRPNPADSDAVPPFDIEIDHQDECIFSCTGSPPPTRQPSCGDKYFPGLDSDTMLDACNGLKIKRRGWCLRITVDGHGTTVGGCGTRTTKEIGGDTFTLSQCFSCREENNAVVLIPKYAEIVECFRKRTGPAGYLRICSCGNVSYSRLCLQYMADKLGATVCMCNGKARQHSNGSFCHCDGNWVCRKPKRPRVWYD